MTKNQIDYFSAKEQARHNAAVEAETSRHNIAGEVETARSNQAVEAETNRHNVATERNQTALNQINRAHYERMDAETARANVARETETARSNRATEAVASYNAITGRLQSNTARMQANTAKQQADTQLAAHELNTRKWDDAQYAQTIIDTYLRNMQAATEHERAELLQEQAYSERVGRVTDVINTASNAIQKVTQSMLNSKQYRYMGIQEARNWIETATEGLRDVGSAIRSVDGIINVFE